MDRYILSLKEICILSAFLVLGGIFAVFTIMTQSHWGVLFHDVEEEIVKIGEIQFVYEIPLTDANQKSLIEGGYPQSFPISTLNEENQKFRDQVHAGLRNHGITTEDLTGKKYAFYAEFDGSKISQLKFPYLFYYSLWSPYKLYLNGSLVSESNGRWTYISLRQINNVISGKNRIVWIVENDTKDTIRGINLKHGLSIRSESSLSRTIERLPVQEQFPRIAASISFFLIGLVAFAFAASSRHFVDLWSFMSFCFLISVTIWMQSPMFYENFFSNPKLLVTIRAIVNALAILASVVLTISYFRLEGQRITYNEIIKNRVRNIPNLIISHPSRLISITAVACCAAIIGYHWPYWTNGSLGYLSSSINTKLSHVMIAAQTAALGLGFISLYKTRKMFKANRLSAQLKVMNRRIILSIIFSISIVSMLAIYGQGFGTISLEIGSDKILLAAIFPAIAMLLMFFWMLSSANRFYQKFVPRLGQIDHEVMAFGKACLAKRYYGSLVVFDLAGMKAIDQIRSVHPQAEPVVDSFLAIIEDDLSRHIQSNRTTFKYKSNGDEFIFCMYAHDKEHAQQMTSEIILEWSKIAAEKIRLWRNILSQNLRGIIDNEAISKLCNQVDMHVLITSLTNIKITVKGGIERPLASPDFIDSRFTSLSGLFKNSKHDRIAVYEDDAQRACLRTIAFNFVLEDQGKGYLELKTDQIQPKIAS